MEIGSRRSFLMPFCLHQVKFIIQSETSVNLFACISERRTGSKLKDTEQFSKPSFKPKT
ncbi:hypothetical protein ECTW09109_2422 [Escherichia coli TW09109]|nr:hypothetical protein ECTW09109_2422 [Escherichia coli TW09109]